jgi:perosamine synthetase
MTSIPNYAPTLAGKELEYLTECVDTGWLSSVGPFVNRFERVFAEYHGVEKAAATASGTAAIHLGLLSLGVSQGDLVLAPNLTFVGSINPIRYCQADPLFLEVHPQNLNLDPQCLDSFLENEVTVTNAGLIHKRSSRRIAALMVVHLYGNPAPMDEILALSRKYQLPVIEDAAESLGARYKGQLVGTFGDVGCFSFNGNKLVTSGGGGMVISRDTRRTEACKHLSTQAKIDPVDFLHDAVGYNYRLSNLCAAVGLAQFEELGRFIQIKREQHSKYQAAFEHDHLWEIVPPPAQAEANYWMHLARLRAGPDSELLPRIRSWINHGVGVRPIWRPLSQQGPYKDCAQYECTRSSDLYNSFVCLPSSVGLSDESILEVHSTISSRNSS